VYLPLSPINTTNLLVSNFFIVSVLKIYVADSIYNQTDNYCTLLYKMQLKVNNKCKQLHAMLLSMTLYVQMQDC